MAIKLPVHNDWFPERTFAENEVGVCTIAGKANYFGDAESDTLNIATPTEEVVVQLELFMYPSNVERHAGFCTFKNIFNARLRYIEDSDLCTIRMYRNNIDYRGRGYGSFMMACLHYILRRYQCTSIDGDFYPDDRTKREETRRFYEKNRFEIDEDSKLHCHTFDPTHYRLYAETSFHPESLPRINYDPLMRS